MIACTEVNKNKTLDAIKYLCVCTDNPLVPFMLANKSDLDTVARLGK